MMSIESARVDPRGAPELIEAGRQGAAVAPRRARYVAPLAGGGDAVVTGLVDTDADHAREPALIEVVTNHARDDQAILCQPSLSRRVIGAKASAGWPDQDLSTSRVRDA